MEKVQQFLDGRLWLRHYAPFSDDLIQQLIVDENITVTEGIETTANWLGKPTYRCRRCENTKQEKFTSFSCASCQKTCVYCRNCLTMGRVASCTELIEWAGEPLFFSTTHEVAWQGQLTVAQQQAADELTASLIAKQDHLLYAVCGAGKTEMLFQPILHMLAKGLRVCVAAPRVDVILELEPRFRQAFPTTTIQALYGGAEPTREASQLVLATTHQLYRFRHAFDAPFVYLCMLHFHPA